MAADLHNQLNRRIRQEFIRAKWSAGSMRSDPVVLRFDDFNTFDSFFVGKFNGAIQAS
jgi:hypothetical protein